MKKEPGKYKPTPRYIHYTVDGDHAKAALMGPAFVELDSVEGNPVAVRRSAEMLWGYPIKSEYTHLH